MPKLCSEAVGGGDRATALRYVNDLRKRAYSDKTLAPISDSDLTLNFIIDERGREFFFEGQRRTDLGTFRTVYYCRLRMALEGWYSQR